MVFVTNYHKLGDLNNISALSCSSVSQKSDTALNGLKSGLAGICSFLEALGENLFPCLFQLLGVTSFLGFMAIFLHFQRQQCCITMIVFQDSGLSLSLTYSSIFKDFAITLDLPG